MALRTNKHSLDSHPRRRVRVLDSEMSFVDVGRGEPIVFLHGNPTSSYVWRNVIPHVADLGRCLAPDLINMGASSPAPSGAYRFFDHVRYLDAWFEAAGVDSNVIFVLHDWGSALGFHRAYRYPTPVQGIAYMEAIVQPRRWDDFPAGRDAIFRRLRGPEGEQMVMEQNFFVEVILPRSIKRELSGDEMAAYRAPFTDLAKRRQTLVWPRELPIEGEPADVVAAVSRYGEWLATSAVPKLFISAEPGALVVGRAREFCRSWTNQEEVTVSGIHYVQEDAPAEIGAALRAFIRKLRA